MELGKLKSAIRSQKGNPAVMVNLGGHMAPVTVQKTSIMETLDKLFEGRNTETGLYLNDAGLIAEDGVKKQKSGAVAAAAPEQSIDLDDLVMDETPAPIEVIDDLDDL